MKMSNKIFIRAITTDFDSIPSIITQFQFKLLLMTIDKRCIKLGMSHIDHLILLFFGQKINSKITLYFFLFIKIKHEIIIRFGTFLHIRYQTRVINQNISPESVFLANSREIENLYFPYKISFWYNILPAKQHLKIIQYISLSNMLQSCISFTFIITYGFISRTCQARKH